MSRERSLLKNGGFEVHGKLAGFRVLFSTVAGDAATMPSVSSPNRRAKRPAARGPGAPGGPLASPTVYLDLPAEAGELFEIRACLRTQDVAGEGYAYMAVYQHAADERIVAFRDFATCRGTQEWTEHRYTFQPTSEVVRIRLQLGLYRATGTAWFDDVRLGKITGLSPAPMNTSTGTPADGLLTQPQQIGVFDPSFPLRRVRALRAADRQHVVDRGLANPGELHRLGRRRGHG